MSKKKILDKINLQIPAGGANPAPPVGSALGKRGVNISDFCKKFNDQSKSMEAGMPIPVVITVYVDKSFSFIMKTPPTSHLIRKAAGLEKGSGLSGRESVGKISIEEVRKIAGIKMADMGVDSLDSAVASVIGSAKSAGIDVIEE